MSEILRPTTPDTDQKPLQQIAQEVFLRHTPENPTSRKAVMDFARRVSEAAGIEDRKTVDSVVGFVQSEWFTAQGVGKKEFNRQRATKSAQWNKLTPEQIAAAQEMALELHGLYSKLLATPAQSLPVDPEYEREKERAHQARLQVGAKFRKKRQLEDRFVSLLRLSDPELQTTNSNERVIFSANPVFARSDQTVQAAIKGRRITQDQYEERKREIQEADRIVQYQIDPEIPQAELLALAKIIHNDQVLRRQLGNSSFAFFVHSVYAILRGEVVLQEDLRNNGIDPKQIINKVRNVISHYYIKRGQMRGLEAAQERPRSRGKISKQDPHLFLDDGSGRSQLGYIQWTPPED